MDALLDADGPMSLATLAEQEVAGLSAPGIYYNLKQLVQDGLVERTGRQKNARYAPRQQIKVQWTARLGTRWKQLEWVSTSPVSWQFPLVSRLTGLASSRDVCQQFLEEMDAQLLQRPDVWLKQAVPSADELRSYLPPSDRHLANRISAEQRQEAYLHLTSRLAYGACIIAVFGSVAQASEGSDSDVDLLVVLPRVRQVSEEEDVNQLVEAVAAQTRRDLAEAFLDLAAKVNLQNLRPIDLHVHNHPERAVPPGLLDTIGKDGVTVYTSGHEAVIESPEAWRVG